ncbi:hypothetical protein TEA_004634 [Camellia sinensis var. sinensis]|uniref:Uncharacterized protein n=1 Tax=Camellia sinensis var. sinensis TaxID=542762 RepID=A0A4V3WPZ8_CAMSN|nr:hypothetical protein TEA_004634 [Camellia sinensis var. sinensis]
MGFLLSNYQLTICILLYSLIFCFSSSSAHLCHNDESTALLQFKQLFSFNCAACDCSVYSAPLPDNWKEGTDCCAWDGVTCDNTTSHVIGLDLRCNCLYGTIHPNSSLFNLVHLQHLDLSHNNFNHSQILPSFGRFTNLTHLDLISSHLSGPIQSSEEEVWQGNNFSNSIFHLQKLQELRLGGNRELTGKLPSFINGTLWHLRHLRSLDLSFIDFTGELPNSIGQLEYLEVLDLGYCNVSGTIPRSFTNLTRLYWLYLGGNNWNNGQFPSSIGHLKNLEQLYLSHCNFYGTIPRSLTNLMLLIWLDLSYNNFEGPIPQLFSNFSLIQYIDFSNNQLTGPIPSSITGLTSLQSLYLGSNSINGIPPSLFHLVSLTELDLSSNNLSDTVELDTFAKLEDLISLDLSKSGLSLTTTNSTPFSFRKIWTLQLSSCNISKIPEFLKTQMEHLETLDLSNNYLNEELNPLCNLYSLSYLDLSNNQLAGLIPTCLGNFNGNLILLNLQKNNFHGSIPQTFGFASMLQLLDISHNGLQGMLPRSLANCTNLEILNLGHNFIEDAFPFWLENLPQLKIIVLRDNKFHGTIEQPRKRLAFTNLHIIDMSHNEFTGTLPSEYFESMHSMMMDDEDKSSLKYMGIGSGYYSVTIMNKGLEMTLVRIITIFKAIDFSHNKFDGKIPISIGRLKALRVLNFSRNGFTGPIPLSLVNLTELESLDLSQNKLSGEIPQQLTSLTFLEVFDVSQNNLTGIIPRGQQFETFSNTSYEGNLGLCGFPLSKNCGNVQIAESPTLPSSFSHNFKFKFDGFGWEAVLMGYGCGVLLGLLIGSYIIQRKEEWLVRIFGVKMRQHGKRSKKIWKKIAHTKSIINCL